MRRADPYSRPFAEQMRERMRERALRFKDLAAITQGMASDRGERGLSAPYLNAVSTGAEQPSPRAMRLIAEALDLQPEWFPEYRLAFLRRLLDPKHDIEAVETFLQLEDALLGSRSHQNLAALLQSLREHG